jgi:hypothetical protein
VESGSDKLAMSGSVVRLNVDSSSATSGGSLVRHAAFSQASWCFTGSSFSDALLAFALSRISARFARNTLNSLGTEITPAVAVARVCLACLQRYE